MATRTRGKLAFHVHHNGLTARLIESIEVRQAYIRKYKPTSERKTRLRLLRLVKGPLPTAVVEALATENKALVACEKARATYVKALVAHDKAQGVACKKTLAAYVKAGAARNVDDAYLRRTWATYVKASDAYGEAQAASGKAKNARAAVLKKYAAEIKALHQAECPNCPWDGETIFPDKAVD